MSIVPVMSDTTQGATMQEKATEAAEFMRLFSTPSRLMLLCHIAQKERSVGEIQEDLDFKQPALSQQLAELRQAGVVQTRRESRQIYYSIADGRVGVVMDMLMQMFCGTSHGPPAHSVAPPHTVVSPKRSNAASFQGEMARWARLERVEQI
jgi:DNA-binding transcriptional ArsR family regulator